MKFVYQMKQYIKSIMLTGLILIVFNIVPKIAHAQIDPGEDPDAPIDGGIGLLVAAGVGYGIKKARDGRKKLENK